MPRVQPGRIVLEIPDLPKPGDRYRIDARYDDDLTLGATTYELTAPRATGVVVVYADGYLYEPLDPDADCVHVDSGRPATYWRPGMFESERESLRRPDRLTVNGIALAGTAVLHTDTLRQRRPDRWSASYRHGRRDLPEATARRTAAILGAVVTHWVTRDPATLIMRLAAARHRVPGFLARQAETIEQQQEALAVAQRAITEAENRAADARQLLADVPSDQPAAGADASPSGPETRHQHDGVE